MGQEGILTSDQVAELLSQQREAENNLESQMEARRNQQMAALRSRLSQRRKKRLDDLREKQERDKMEVCKTSISEDSEILPAKLKTSSDYVQFIYSLAFNQIVARRSTRGIGRINGRERRGTETRKRSRGGRI